MNGSTAWEFRDGKFGAFQALIGVRYDEYTDKENYKKATENKVKQHSFLPRFGLTYTLNPNINLYGTYVKGYNPQTASSLSNPNGLVKALELSILAILENSLLESMTC